jgi:hypothetical protein
MRKTIFQLSGNVRLLFGRAIRITVTFSAGLNRRRVSIAKCCIFCIDCNRRYGKKPPFHRRSLVGKRADLTAVDLNATSDFCLAPARKGRVNRPTADGCECSAALYYFFVCLLESLNDLVHDLSAVDQVQAIQLCFSPPLLSGHSRAPRAIDICHCETPWPLPDTPWQAHRAVMPCTRHHHRYC